jgi:hypothetical protein
MAITRVYNEKGKKATWDIEYLEGSCKLLEERERTKEKCMVYAPPSPI